MIPYILTNESLTVIINGKSLTMNKENPSFKSAIKALQEEDYDKVERLFDTATAVEEYADGNVKVSNGVLTYKGEEVHNYCTEKILQFMSEDLPYKPLVKFFEKLMQNPSRRAVNELYKFLEHKAMPLTATGNFLAYKSVRDDYTDWHTGKFSNKVGESLEMVRNNVCDDAEIGCSNGFHAGSLEYAESFGYGGHLMVVEINPTDVVSVPKDCDCQKLRTCKYKVVDHFKTKLKDSYCEDYDIECDSDEDEDEYSRAFNEGFQEGFLKGSGFDG